ncbi:MAG: hypothetical protein EB127_16865, partial [Alphaproteobacteria bacterium]|nr:hypothetical protein [Alphaproteobacteria bacterium]
MSDSMFRIKKGRDAKYETLGGTLDSVHQTVISSLRDSQANQESLADQIMKLEIEIGELESGKNQQEIFKLAQKHDKLRTLQTELKDRNQLDAYFLKNADLMLQYYGQSESSSVVTSKHVDNNTFMKYLAPTVPVETGPSRKQMFDEYVSRMKLGTGTESNDVNTDTCTYVDTVQFTGDTLQERCRVRDELIAKGLIKNKGNGWLGEISDYENNDGAFYHIKPNAGTLKMPYLPAIEYKYMFGYLNGIMGITILSLIICIIIYFATSGKTKENTLIALIISAVITVITISIKWYYSNKERKLYEKYEPKPRIVQEFTDSMKRYLDKKIP